MSTNTKVKTVKISGSFGDENGTDDFSFEISASASREDIEEEISDIVRESYEKSRRAELDGYEDDPKGRRAFLRHVSDEETVCGLYEINDDADYIEFDVDVSDITLCDTRKRSRPPHDFTHDGSHYRTTGEKMFWGDDLCYKWEKNDPSTSPVDINGVRTTGGFTFDMFIIDHAEQMDVVRAFDMPGYVVTDFD